MADSIDVIEMFKQAAFEVDNRRLPELKGDTVIATLGMDSVAVMELVSYFEEKLRVRIPDEELSKIRTVRDLRDTIARLAPAPEQTQCGWVSSLTLSSVSICAVLVTFPQSWVAAAATLSAPIGMPKRTKARRPSAVSMSASASRHTYTAPSSTKYARPEGAPAVVSARTIAAAQSATYTTLSVFFPSPVIGSTPLRTEVKNASVSRSRGP